MDVKEIMLEYDGIAAEAQVHTEEVEYSKEIQQLKHHLSSEYITKHLPIRPDSLSALLLQRCDSTTLVDALRAASERVQRDNPLQLRQLNQIFTILEMEMRVRGLQPDSDKQSKRDSKRVSERQVDIDKLRTSLRDDAVMEVLRLRAFLDSRTSATPDLPPVSLTGTGTAAATTSLGLDASTRDPLVSLSPSTVLPAPQPDNKVIGEPRGTTSGDPAPVWPDARSPQPPSATVSAQPIHANQFPRPSLEQYVKECGEASKLDPDAVQRCAICHASEAYFHCGATDCNLWLCVECFKSHRDRVKTKKHAIALLCPTCLSTPYASLDACHGCEQTKADNVIECRKCKTNSHRIYPHSEQESTISFTYADLHPAGPTPAASEAPPVDAVAPAVTRFAVAVAPLPTAGRGPAFDVQAHANPTSTFGAPSLTDDEQQRANIVWLRSALESVAQDLLCNLFSHLWSTSHIVCSSCKKVHSVTDVGVECLIRLCQASNHDLEQCLSKSEFRRGKPLRDSFDPGMIASLVLDLDIVAGCPLGALKANVENLRNVRNTAFHNVKLPSARLENEWDAMYSSVMALAEYLRVDTALLAQQFQAVRKSLTVSHLADAETRFFLVLAERSVHLSKPLLDTAEFAGQVGRMSLQHAVRLCQASRHSASSELTRMVLVIPRFKSIPAGSTFLTLFPWAIVLDYNEKPFLSRSQLPHFASGRLYEDLKDPNLLGVDKTLYMHHGLYASVLDPAPCLSLEPVSKFELLVVLYLPGDGPHDEVEKLFPANKNPHLLLDKEHILPLYSSSSVPAHLPKLVSALGGDLAAVISGTICNLNILGSHVISTMARETNLVFQSCEDGRLVGVARAEMKCAAHELDVLTVDCGLRPTYVSDFGDRPPDVLISDEFAHALRGHPISWFLMRHGHYAKRSVYESVRATVADAFIHRPRSVVVLEHAPSTGGSTVLRTLLYEFYEKYVCVVVNPDANVSRAADDIGLLSLTTKRAALVMLDGNNRMYYPLREALRRLGLTFVMVQATNEGLGLDDEHDGKTMFMEATLSPTEACGFQWLLKKRRIFVQYVDEEQPCEENLSSLVEKAFCMLDVISIPLHTLRRLVRLPDHLLLQAGFFHGELGLIRKRYQQMSCYLPSDESELDSCVWGATSLLQFGLLYFSPECTEYVKKQVVCKELESQRGLQNNRSELLLLKLCVFNALFSPYSYISDGVAVALCGFPVSFKSNLWTLLSPTLRSWLCRNRVGEMYISLPSFAHLLAEQGAVFGPRVEGRGYSGVKPFLENLVAELRRLDCQAVIRPAISELGNDERSRIRRILENAVCEFDVIHPPGIIAEEVNRKFPFLLSLLNQTHPPFVVELLKSLAQLFPDSTKFSTRAAQLLTSKAMKELNVKLLDEAVRVLKSLAPDMQMKDAEVWGRFGQIEKTRLRIWHKSREDKWAPDVLRAEVEVAASACRHFSKEASISRQHKPHPYVSSLQVVTELLESLKLPTRFGCKSLSDVYKLLNGDKRVADYLPMREVKNKDVRQDLLAQWRETLGLVLREFPFESLTAHLQAGHRAHKYRLKDLSESGFHFLSSGTTANTKTLLYKMRLILLELKGEMKVIANAQPDASYAQLLARTFDMTTVHHYSMQLAYCVVSLAAAVAVQAPPVFELAEPLCHWCCYLQSTTPLDHFLTMLKPAVAQATSHFLATGMGGFIDQWLAWFMHNGVPGLEPHRYKVVCSVVRAIAEPGDPALRNLESAVSGMAQRATLYRNTARGRLLIGKEVRCAGCPLSVCVDCDAQSPSDLDLRRKYEALCYLFSGTVVPGRHGHCNIRCNELGGTEVFLSKTIMASNRIQQGMKVSFLLAIRDIGLLAVGALPDS